jgi:hypothetical protein
VLPEGRIISVQALSREPLGNEWSESTSIGMG